jgi:hypothetical protein
MIKRTDFSVLFFHKKKPYSRKKYPRYIWENGFKFAEIFKFKDNAVMQAQCGQSMKYSLFTYILTCNLAYIKHSFMHAWKIA